MIKDVRQNANMSQKELAKKIGVSEGALSLYENGKREPNFTTLKKLAEIFSCTLDELIR